MVDLDGDVVEVCKKHLPEWNDGSTEDPRLTVHIGDARSYLVEGSDTFDVVVLDISDPIEAGPAVHLYTKEFYDLVRQKLNPGGVLVTQSGPAGLMNHTECFGAIHKTLAASFSCVVPYSVSIPSFGSDWGFNVATDRGDVSSQALREKPPNTTDEEIRRRINGPLRHYDGGTHLCMFNLIKAVRDGVAKEDRVITEANPVFMY